MGTNNVNVQQAPLAVSVEEAARLAGIGRTSLYAAISSGELPSIRHGRRRLILRTAIEEWLSSLASIEPPAGNPKGAVEPDSQPEEAA